MIYNKNDKNNAQAKFLKEVLFEKKINILLFFLPFAWLSQRESWSSTSVFWFNFISMIPLANILGDFTEELALLTNQIIGGIINATFGNAVEVVVAFQALMAGQLRVVQASLLGSIFSNLLLVLGCCLLFGGFLFPTQSFNGSAVTANISLLTLSCIVMVLPTPFSAYYELDDENVLEISRISSIFLILLYILLLIFQLKTHSHLFADADDHEEASITFFQALGGLTLTTAMITVLSNWLVDSIDGFVLETGASKTFVAVIIIPIVGNAVEHITAVTFAMKNKMDLSMSIALGSCTQISLFVFPFMVLTGWYADIEMTLNFPHLEVILLASSVITVWICLRSANTNWLLGSLLLTLYTLVGVGFWFENTRQLVK